MAPLRLPRIHGDRRPDTDQESLPRQRSHHVKMVEFTVAVSGICTILWCIIVLYGLAYNSSVKWFTLNDIESTFENHTRQLMRALQNVSASVINTTAS